MRFLFLSMIFCLAAGYAEETKEVADDTSVVIQDPDEGSNIADEGEAFAADKKGKGGCGC